MGESVLQKEISTSQQVARLVERLSCEVCSISRT